MIILDPGHGGIDSGASHNGVVESVVNLQVAKKVGDILTTFKTPYTMTRTTNTFISLGDRCRISNNLPTKLFVSIHCNAMPKGNEQVKGIELFRYPLSNRGQKVAENFRAEMVQIAKTVIKVANFQVLRETIAPAILVELGFLTNREEANLLARADYQNLLAYAIAKGVQKCLQ